MKKQMAQVGQMVSFKDAEGKEQFDYIEYMDSDVIEGKKFDLTYIDFTIIDFALLSA
jgi:hypothetical protein